MRHISIVLLLVALVFTPKIQAQNCDAALVQNHIAYEGDDVQRMTHSFLLDEKSFYEKSKDGGLITGYGTADYDEFQRKTDSKRQATATAIGRDQWQAYGRWYLSDNARSAYVSCLEASRLKEPGIFLRVSDADSSIVQFKVVCERGVNDPTEFPLTFGEVIGGAIVGDAPQKVSCGRGGSAAIQVKRIKNEPLRIIVTSGTNYSDSLIVPRYIRIIADTVRSPIESELVKAYCPYGPGNEETIILHPSKAGLELDTKATQFLVMRRHDYGGQLRVESNVTEVTSTAEVAVGKVKCWPGTRKGAVVEGKIISMEHGINYSIVDE